METTSLLILQIWSLLLHVVASDSFKCPQAPSIQSDCSGTTDVFSLSINCSREGIQMTVSKNTSNQYQKLVAVDYNCSSTTAVGNFGCSLGYKKDSCPVQLVPLGPVEHSVTCYFHTCSFDELDYCWRAFNDAPTECLVEVPTTTTTPPSAVSNISISDNVVYNTTSVGYEMMTANSSLLLSPTLTPPIGTLSSTLTPPIGSSISTHVSSSISTAISYSYQSLQETIIDVVPSQNIATAASLSRLFIISSSPLLHSLHHTSSYSSSNSISIKGLDTRNQAPSHMTTTTTPTRLFPSQSTMVVSEVDISSTQSGSASSSSSTPLPFNSSSFSMSEITFVIVATAVVIIVAMLVSLTCLLVIQRNKRNKFTGRIMMNYDDPGIVFQKNLDQISFTESIVTVVESLEVNLHSSSNGKQRVTMTTAEDREELKTIEGLDQPSNDQTTMEAENELQKSSFHGSPSLSSISPVADFNDCISCNSADSCGYIETTATKLSSSQFIDSLRASTDTSSPLHCPRLHIQPVPPLDDISIQSSQFSDDGYEQSATSEGYATERTSDYIETDNSGGLYPPLRATTAISMCNAQVNDYVFQKKINNRFLLQSSPSSSGYYSDQSSCHYKHKQADSTYHIPNKDIELLKDYSNTSSS